MPIEQTTTLNTAAKGKSRPGLSRGLVLTLLFPWLAGLASCSSAFQEPPFRTEPWYALKHSQNVENVVTYQPRALQYLADMKIADDEENQRNFEAMEARRRLGLALRLASEREQSRDPAKFIAQLQRTFRVPEEN